MAQTGIKGSKRCLQAYLSDDNKRKELEEKVCEIIRWAVKEIDWLGPKQSDDGWDWKELTGNAFWNAIGVNPKDTREFWPARGPHWDAIARLTLEDGSYRYVLFEAKANVQELKSWMRTKSDDSRKLIKRTLKTYTRSAPSYYYQTRNRIAHKKFINEKIKGMEYVKLCYLIFENDMTHIETSEEEWRTALKQEHQELGLNERQAEELFNEIYLDASWVSND